MTNVHFFILVGFINNFGQIAKQLFKKAHPCKKMTSSRTSIIDANPLLSSAVTQNDKLFFNNLDILKPVRFIHSFFFLNFAQISSEVDNALKYIQFQC